jgi:hypothetical protein
MGEKDCLSCFYGQMDKGIHPCSHCHANDHWVKRDLYIKAPQTIDKEIEEFFERAKDVVNNPKHYTEHPSGIECIEVTEHMGFNLGNAIKYIWRCDLKKDAIEDLKKAKWYIDREINKRVKHNI